jgi:hypothetical protein
MNNLRPGLGLVLSSSDLNFSFVMGHPWARQIKVDLFVARFSFRLERRTGTVMTLAHRQLMIEQ